MKPLRTGLAAGLLAGGAAAANKLVSDWRGGAIGMSSAKVVTGINGKSPPKGGALGGVTEAVGTAIARRAAKRAEANRPPWVVAPVPGASAGMGMGGGPAVSVSAAPSRALASSRPAAAPARKLPSLESLKPPSAKSVGASVGKYAVKQAGKAIGKAAADRVGKAIEVIEVLEKVVAAASSESAAKPDLTPSGPGSVANATPVAANLATTPAHPGLVDAPSTGGGDAAEAAAKPRGTLVSVRKFERGPRVVVGPGVNQPTPTPAGEAAVEAAVEVVVEAVEAAVNEAAVTEAAAMTEAAATDAAASVAPRLASEPAAASAPAEAGAHEAAAGKKAVAKPKAAAKKPAVKRAPAKAKPAGSAAEATPAVAGVDDRA